MRLILADPSEFGSEVGEVNVTNPTVCGPLWVIFTRCISLLQGVGLGQFRKLCPASRTVVVMPCLAPALVGPAMKPEAYQPLSVVQPPVGLRRDAASNRGRLNRL